MQGGEQSSELQERVREAVTALPEMASEDQDDRSPCFQQAALWYFASEHISLARFGIDRKGYDFTAWHGTRKFTSDIGYNVKTEPCDEAFYIGFSKCCILQPHRLVYVQT